MGSDSAPAIESLATAAAIENGVISGDSIHTNTEELNGFSSKKHLIPEENDNGQALTGSTLNGDDGSGWLNDGNNSSGWISADGAPVVLPSVTASTQPWTSSKQHTLYLIRVPRSVDDKLRNEIKLAEAKLEQTIKKRDAHKVALQAKKNSKMELLEKLKPIREKERACRDALQGKQMELEPFSAALNKFRNVQSRGQDICSSEEELNDKIAEIQFRIQHESIPLKEEKQLLREIKQLESTRSQVCANSVLHAELMENLGPKEEIQDQAKFLRQDLDSIRKEHSKARMEYDAIDKEINKLNEAIEELWQLYEKANAVQQEAYVVVRELKRQENLKNDPFYQNKRDVQVARDLASQRKVKEVEEFCVKQVEDFLVMWNKDAKFRVEYVKSNERSTVRRLETLDGRALGPNEKPPVINEVDVVQPKSRDAKLTPVADFVVSKVDKVSGSGIAGHEVSNGVVVKETMQEKHISMNAGDKENGSSKPRHIDNGEDSFDSEAQAAELKEKLRQEQIAKAREAEERKKKRSDKLESKALVRAKKDAERKEKEREKRALKKAAAAASPSLSEPTNLNDEPGSMEGKQVVDSEHEVIPDEDLKSAAKKDKKESVTRRKLSGKDLKVSRPLLNKRVSKKAAWPIPVWAMALIVALVLLVTVILFMRL